MRLFSICAFLATLFFGAASSEAFANPACWNTCTASGRSTKSCVQSCGLEGAREQRVCYDYCRGRRGSEDTCNALCGYDSGDSDSSPSFPRPRPVTPPEDRNPDDGRGGRQGSQCRMSMDCPTFFSCSNGWCVRGSNNEGSQCRMSMDCPTFYSCSNGWCVRGSNNEGSQCRMSMDCPTFYSCSNGWCVR